MSFCNSYHFIQIEKPAPPSEQKKSHTTDDDSGLIGYKSIGEFYEYLMQGGYKGSSESLNGA